MNVLDQFRQSLERTDQILAKTDRMGGSKAQSREPVDLVQRSAQLYERTFFVDLRELMAAIQVYDLSKESDFFHAARDQIACFAHNFRNGATALGATGL